MTYEDYQEIEHTADWALRVRGDDLASLFASAARGMFSLLTDVSAVEETWHEQIELEAPDVETLLIDWLNELLYRAEENGVVFARFEMHALERADSESRAVEREACATLRATAIGGAPKKLDKTIKAATFSSLHVVRDRRGYSTEIVFDV